MGVWGCLELIHLPGWLMGDHGASCGPSVAMKNHTYPLSLFSHPLTSFILGWSPCLHRETPSAPLATGLVVSLILHRVWAHLTGLTPFLSPDCSASPLCPVPFIHPCFITDDAGKYETTRKSLPCHYSQHSRHQACGSTSKCPGPHAAVLQFSSVLTPL